MSRADDQSAGRYYPTPHRETIKRMTTCHASTRSAAYGFPAAASAFAARRYDRAKRCCRHGDSPANSLGRSVSTVQRRTVPAPTETFFPARGRLLQQLHHRHASAHRVDHGQPALGAAPWVSALRLAAECGEIQGCAGAGVVSQFGARYRPSRAVVVHVRAPLCGAQMIPPEPLRHATECDRLVTR